MRKTHRKMAVIAAAGLIAAGGTAFTNANTATPNTSVGQESEVTTGYAVSNVNYALDAAFTDAEGDDIRSVTFDLTADVGADIATDARVQLETGDIWYDCAPGAAAGQLVPFTCAIPAGVNAIDIDVLNIVAVSDTTP